MNSRPNNWDAATRVHEKYSKTSFPSASSGAISELENKIGVQLPATYRDYLLKFNGGFFVDPTIVEDTSIDRPEDGLTYLRGISATHDSAELGSRQSLALYDDNDPVCVLPIGGTIMGNLLLMYVEYGADDYGTIALATPDDAYFLADNILEFFSLITDP